MPIRSLVALLIAGGVAYGSAQTTPKARGTAAEAQALLSKAAAHYEKVGRTQALADFTAKKAPFADRDLYVFCFASDRTISAHGADAAQVGRKVEELKDVDGKAFGVALWNAGSKPGGGSVEYRWLNPVTNKVEPKISFVRKVGAEICGVGAYK
jgi:cytochrome c